jgi:hypothetical protein
MGIRRMALLGSSGLLTLGAVAGCVPTMPASAAPAVPEIAPYFETSATHTGNLNTAIASHGLKSFTVAFVLGKGCSPTWDNSTPISTATAENALVTKAKSKGAIPIISFGGAEGTELAKACPSPTKTPNTTKLVAAYSSVINKFGVTKVDFDIEGTAISDAATNNYRFLAIKTLEKNYPKLEVSLTIPVGLSGLDPSGVSFLKAAKTQGTRIDVVNIMTMSYGSPGSNMGTAAVTAAKDTLKQMKAIWPASTYKNLGITPMIGQNDSPGEVFSWNDSQTVVTFAKTNGVHRLAFWDLNRDQACTAEDSPPDTCSEVRQRTLDYTDGFLN